MATPSLSRPKVRRCLTDETMSSTSTAEACSVLPPQRVSAPSLVFGPRNEAAGDVGRERSSSSADGTPSAEAMLWSPNIAPSMVSISETDDGLLNMGRLEGGTSETDLSASDLGSDAPSRHTSRRSSVGCAPSTSEARPDITASFGRRRSEPGTSKRLQGLRPPSNFLQRVKRLSIKEYLPGAWPQHVEHVTSRAQWMVKRFLLSHLPDHDELEDSDLVPKILPEDFRLMPRDHAFQQSSGTMSISRVHRDAALLSKDIFHLLVEFPTHKLLSLFCLVYVLSFLFFAIIIRLVDSHCELNIDSFMDALYLSVETMMTIGYGVPDPLFKECESFVFVMVAQSLLGVIYDAVITGLIYQRLARGKTRAATIIFSDKAVIRTIGEHTYLMFRVCEMRRTQLLECHIRCYLYTRTRPKFTGRASSASSSSERSDDELKGRIYSSYRQEPMRLDRPDDTLGGMVFPIFPELVAHRIDAWSPILRNAVWPYGHRDCAMDAMSRQVAYGHAERQLDTEVGSRDGAWCDACGESFQLREQLWRHCQWYARQGDDPEHQRLIDNWVPAPTSKAIRKAIQNHLDKHDIEVVVILEGVDATTSASVQARHSFTTEEMVWDHEFEQVIFENEDRDVFIDFSQFHGLRPVPAPSFNNKFKSAGRKKSFKAMEASQPHRSVLDGFEGEDEEVRMVSSLPNPANPQDL